MPVLSPGSLVHCYWPTQPEFSLQEIRGVFLKVVFGGLHLLAKGVRFPFPSALPWFLSLHYKAGHLWNLSHFLVRLPLQTKAKFLVFIMFIHTKGLHVSGAVVFVTCTVSAVIAHLNSPFTYPPPSYYAVQNVHTHTPPNLSRTEIWRKMH